MFMLILAHNRNAGMRQIADCRVRYHNPEEVASSSILSIQPVAIDTT
jgi:hypothetical protein